MDYSNALSCCSNKELFNGSSDIMDDSKWPLQHLNDLTNEHESAKSNSWKVSDAPEDFILTRRKP